MARRFGGAAPWRPRLVSLRFENRDIAGVIVDYVQDKSFAEVQYKIGKE